jgi:hypothetical protein
MSPFHALLVQLAKYYEGEYNEWMSESGIECAPDGIKMTAQEFNIVLHLPLNTGMKPQTICRQVRQITPKEPLEEMKERTRYDMLWAILEQGIEHIVDKRDIFNLFNPNQTL